MLPEQEAELYIKILKENKLVGFDIESSGLDWKKNYVCGWGISNGVETAYVPVRHGTNNIGQADNFEKTIAALFKQRTAPVVGHSVKFDYKFAYKHGVDIGSNLVDTMVMAALINEEQRGGYSLSRCCQNYNITQKADKELYAHLSKLFNVKPTRTSMSEFHRLSGIDPIGTEYAKIDNIAVLELYKAQQRELALQDLEYVSNLENRLTYVLAQMELKGVKIDLEEKEKVKKEVEELHFEAYRALPLSDDFMPINIRSAKDLQHYFEMHQIEDWPITEKGNPSFTKQYLGQTSQGELILNARKYDHLINSFITPLDNYIYNGRIFTNFNQTMSEFGGTRSGRLSSTNPNMQQVPKRDKFLGRIFRRMFIPDPGFIFVEFDYSQAEPRLYSHYSGEPTLVRGYNSNPPIDMHSVAAEYMHVTRDVAKNLNLGMMYVMGAEKLALQLGISIDEAKQISYKWHRTFPEVSSFTKAAAQRAESRGYVRTILGRRSRFPDPRSSYRAANRIVQGGSADILKYKIVQISSWIKENGLEDQVQMLLNIHDAILFQIREEVSEKHIAEIKRILEDVNGPPFKLTIPFIAEYKKGKDWKEATYD
jgi:DNA polymerase-1